MRSAAATLSPLPEWRAPSSIIEDDTRTLHSTASNACIEHLAAGDVFQVNLSRGWRARFDAPLPPAQLHARLRTANPAPFAGLFAGARTGPIVSSSPERLVSIRGDAVETRPIAGTRPRLPGDDEAARIRELVGHPKERAEHVMLIDLERNDLGRVCTPGSVEVDELMTVESYAHVHHIVSNVRGRLREDATPGDVIRAVFPGGTITGCPKVRCMQIIAALEGQGRGAYTGAFGWLNRDGDLDLNILIRSAELEGDDAALPHGRGHRHRLGAAARARRNAREGARPAARAGRRRMSGTTLFIGETRIDALPGDARGFAYGDGMFETMRVHRGTVPWWACASRAPGGRRRSGLRLSLPDDGDRARSSRALFDDAGRRCR